MIKDFRNFINFRFGPRESGWAIISVMSALPFSQTNKKHW